MPKVSAVLKIAIFATGCAGIVAEFVLSTLATYLSGDAVFQWTMIMSLMLFSMGLGSRFSRRFTTHLLDIFVMVEFSLSLLCAICAIAAYGLFGLISQIHLVIYAMAMAIGGLIGFEIPLVTRINEAYEELSANIASVLEKDYYGSLLGGLFFAFFALPRLGLTYTPIALGAINYLVASVFVVLLPNRLVRRRLTFGLCALTGITLVLLGFLARPIILFGEQQQYRDKVILARQTAYQKIVMTRWKKDYWLYINGQEQFSTFDEERYHEPLVHPALALAATHANILILGGGDGLALREVWKHTGVAAVTLVDLDPEMTHLAANYPILTNINAGSMHDRRLTLVHEDARRFVTDTDHHFDVVIIDLPDPDTIDLMHLYSLGFYRQVKQLLNAGGVMVTQATSPYFAPRSFWCIAKTIAAAGFTVLPYHNQVPTMGEWGFVLAKKAGELNAGQLKAAATRLSFDHLPTRFLNQDAMIAMIHFGKTLSVDAKAAIEVNTEFKPVLKAYYQSGGWDMY